MTLLLVATGCELGKTVVPRQQPFLVVHSILNPASRTQTVLVERSLTGAIDVTNRDYDPRNPIATEGGDPVLGADVRITDPDGIVMQGIPNANAPGVYQISLDTYKTNLKPGRRYSIKVIADGDTVTGSTLVPGGSVPAGVPTVPFNRDHDALSIQIRDVNFAAAYWVQILGPTQPYELFSFDTSIAIAGDARNVFSDNLIKVFYPGFLQSMTVSAIDSNVYDYYRSGNDPFTGSGMINHLTGGIGLFGSLVVVDRRQIDVTQDSVDAIDGTYTPRGFALSQGAPRAVTLYREAPGDHGIPDRISGKSISGSLTAPIRAAIYGTRSGDSLDLKFLSGQSTGDVAFEFIGHIRGDSLISQLGSTQRIVYVRVGK